MREVRIFNEKHYSCFADFEYAINEYLSLFASRDNYQIEYKVDSRGILIVIVERI